VKEKRIRRSLIIAIIRLPWVAIKENRPLDYNFIAFHPAKPPKTKKSHLSNHQNKNQETIVLD